MKPFFIKLITLAICLLPAMWTCGAEEKVVGKIRVTLRPDRTEILVGESLMTNVLLENISKEKQEVFYPWNTIKFDMRTNEGPWSEDLLHGFRINETVYGWVKLSPGEIEGKSETLFIRRDMENDSIELLFPKPGVYHLRTRITLNQDEVESESVAITVKDPPADEAKVLAALKEPKIARALIGWEFSNEVIASLEKLIEQYPKSALMDQAHDALGGLYGSVKKEYAKAYPHYAAVSDRQDTRKLQALLRQNYLVGVNPKMVNDDEIKRLIAEFEKRKDLAEKTGYATPSQDARKSLERIIDFTLPYAIKDWVALLEGNKLAEASTHWCKDEAAGKQLALYWEGLQKAHQTYDYRKFLESAENTTFNSDFTVGGHAFDHLHVIWGFTAEGWKIKDVQMCR